MPWMAFIWAGEAYIACVEKLLDLLIILSKYFIHVSAISSTIPILCPQCDWLCPIQLKKVNDLPFLQLIIHTLSMVI